MKLENSLEFKKAAVVYVIQLNSKAGSHVKYNLGSRYNCNLWQLVTSEE